MSYYEGEYELGGLEVKNKRIPDTRMIPSTEITWQVRWSRCGKNASKGISGHTMGNQSVLEVGVAFAREVLFEFCHETNRTGVVESAS
jgi:hypothetical protein